MLSSILIYTQFVICSLLYIIAVAPFYVLTLLYCYAFRHGDCRSIVRFFILWYGKTTIHAGLWPYVRISYEDRSGVPDRGGIYIFNHRSATDAYLVSKVTNIPPVQIVNAWPMRLPFLGTIARQGGYIDIMRLSAEDLFKQIGELVACGVPVAAFPEGTRSGSRNMNQFHSGIFRIAKELDCPVVPVAIVGNEEIPNRQFRMKCGRIRICKLPPVPQEIVRTATPYKLKNYVRNQLLARCAEMDSEQSGD